MPDDHISLASFFCLKSSSSAAHLLSNGSSTLPENETRLESDTMNGTSPLPSLIFYAAIARSSKILAEYSADSNPDMPTIAATCLENVPPFHIRFSYTTNQRRFICIMEGFLTYCAIMDESLSKADAFSFLLNIKNAFKSLGKRRGPDSLSVTLGAYFLDDEMTTIMRNLAVQFVGVSRKEKNHIEADLQAHHRDTEVEVEGSSPSTVAPVHETNDQDFDAKTKERPLGSKLPIYTWISRVKKGKKTKDQATDVNVDDKGTENLSIVVDGGVGAVKESNTRIDIGGKQSARERWRRKVKYVVVLDVITCLVLLAVWLGVCGGISCVKQ